MSATGATCKRNFYPLVRPLGGAAALAESPRLLPEKGKKSSGVYLTVGYAGLPGFFGAFEGQYGPAPTK